MLCQWKLEISLRYTAQLNLLRIICFWLAIFFYCIRRSQQHRQLSTIDKKNREVHKQAHQNAPDYSHYFSRFIGKSYCRVIIITIVTLKRFSIQLFLSVWPSHTCTNQLRCANVESIVHTQKNHGEKISEQKTNIHNL